MKVKKVFGVLIVTTVLALLLSTIMVATSGPVEDEPIGMMLPGGAGPVEDEPIGMMLPGGAGPVEDEPIGTMLPGGAGPVEDEPIGSHTVNAYVI